MSRFFLIEEENGEIYEEYGNFCIEGEDYQYFLDGAQALVNENKDDFNYEWVKEQINKTVHPMAKPFLKTLTSFLDIPEKMIYKEVLKMNVLHCFLAAYRNKLSKQFLYNNNIFDPEKQIKEIEKVIGASLLDQSSLKEIFSLFIKNKT